MLCMLPTLSFSFEQRNASALFDTCQLLSLVPLNFLYLLIGHPPKNYPLSARLY